MNTENTKDVVAVDTKKQLTASDILINECRQIYEAGIENDLIWRWQLGKKIDQTYANQTAYESSILKRLSDELDIATSDLSRFKKFYHSFSEDKIAESAAKGFSWSHFKIVNDLPDGQIKDSMKLRLESSDKAPKTKDLQAEIDDKKEKQVDGTGGADATRSGDANAAAPGDKTHRTSPLRPINSALNAIEKLCDHLGDIIIAIGDGVDFDTEKQQEVFDDKFGLLKTRLEEVAAYSEKLSGASVNGDKVDKDKDKGVLYSSNDEETDPADLSKVDLHGKKPIGEELF